MQLWKPKNYGIKLLLFFSFFLNKYKNNSNEVCYFSNNNNNNIFFFSFCIKRMAKNLINKFLNNYGKK